MNHRIQKAYLAFTSKPWPVPEVKPGASPEAADPVSFLSDMADPNHSILLRALLDSQPQGFPATASNEDGLSAGPAAFALARDRLGALREEAATKFLEFRERWRKRLAFAQLNPFLQRNQWMTQTLEGFGLVGKGTRKDAKMLYLQSLHDMASDGERQVSSLSAQVFRLESEVAAQWYRDAVYDNASRLLPALESSLRPGESDLFKRLRLSLGDLAQETFVERVHKWDRRFHATEEELFRDIAWPWRKERHASGFEGFMESYADLSEALSATLFGHYENKWDLFLRGLAPSTKG